MQPAWIAVIVVTVVAIGLAAGLLVVALDNDSKSVTVTPKMSTITLHSSILDKELPDSIETLDEQYEPLVSPDSREYEISAVTDVSISPSGGAKRAKRYIYKKRNPTGWYATVHRFQMGFHSIYMRQKIIFGEEGIPSSDSEPPYRYDSLDPGMIVPNVSPLNQMFSVEMDLACTARYLDFEFEIYSRIHTIRVDISYNGVMGDIVLWNEENAEFEYYDADTGMFTIERPANTASLSPPNMHLELKELAKKYAVPIPVSILNGVSWDNIDENSALEIELVPDTSVMFRREPPKDYNREWIMKNVCFPSLTNAISAIVNVF